MPRDAKIKKGPAKLIEVMTDTVKDVETNIYNIPKVPNPFRKKGGPKTKYKESFALELFDHMSKGYPFRSFAAVKGVTQESLDGWCKDHPLFKASKETGKRAAEFLWINIGMGLATGELKGNATAWTFIMKNLFNWTDKTETDLNIGVSTKSYMEAVIDESYKWDKTRETRLRNKALKAAATKDKS